MGAEADKLYALCRDRQGRKKWGVVGSVTHHKDGSTEYHFETVPTGPWGWRVFTFPEGALFPEPPADKPQQQPQQQQPPDGESEKRTLQ
jgi:hypothetical protein